MEDDLLFPDPSTSGGPSTSAQPPTSGIPPVSTAAPTVAGSSNVEIVEKLPPPDVPIQQTTRWLSARHQSLLSVEARIITNNLEVLSVQMHELKEMVAEMLADRGKSSRRSSLSTKAPSSRRSSLRGHPPQPPSDGVAKPATDPNKSIEVCNDLCTNDVESLTQLFESFILRSKKTPLVTGTRNAKSSSTAFTDFIEEEAALCFTEDAAAMLLSKIGVLEEAQKVDLYIFFSKIYKAEKTKGKRVQTVAESFRTDVRADSQSTNGTPKQRRVTRSVSAQPNPAQPNLPPKTPRAPRRRPTVISSDSSTDDSE